MTRPKSPVSAKVDPEIKRKLELVAKDEEVTLSEIGRRGLRHYALENPDGYDVLGGKDFVAEMLEELEP